jgi:HEXXH motif-containing protein
VTRPAAAPSCTAAAVGLDPGRTAAWLRAYHGALAVRLVHQATRLGWADTGAGRAYGVRSLHPRAVWAARVAVEQPDLVADGGLPVSDLLAASRTPSAAPEHVGADRDEPWARWGVATVDAQVTQLWPQPPMRLAAAPLGSRRTNVDRALAVLYRVWPEAATELRLQVRAVVHVEGGGFRSATADEVFGAVFVGERYNDSVPAAFEMLVHESAHLALVLRRRFQPFVTNGADLAGHPLRPDPRPVSGTVHAAYALARMATGLALWRDEGGAPAEVARRAEESLANLVGAVAVLREKAAWTDEGRAWFARLEQHTEEVAP